MQVVIALFLSFAFQDPDPSLFLAAPAGASAEDLGKAAAALKARCELYGYKDISATPVERAGQKGVEVSCPTKITREMRGRISQLAAFAGQDWEVRLAYSMTDVEREQYKFAEKPEEETAPTGAKWWRWRERDYKYAALLRNEPVFKKAELSVKLEKGVKYDGRQAYVLEFEVPALGKFRPLSKAARDEKAFLIVDGRIWGGSGSIAYSEQPNRIWDVKFSPPGDSYIFYLVTAKPMPFALAEPPK